MLQDALCVIVHNPFYRAAQCCSQFPVLRRQESFLKFYPPLDRSSRGYEQTEPFTANYVLLHHRDLNVLSLRRAGSVQFVFASSLVPPPHASALRRVDFDEVSS